MALGRAGVGHRPRVVEEDRDRDRIDELLVARPGLVLAVAAGDEAQRAALAQVGECLQPQGLRTQVVQPVGADGAEASRQHRPRAHARQLVDDVAPKLLDLVRQPGTGVGEAQAPRDESLALAAAVLPQRRSKLRLETLRGPGRDQVHGAARGIAPVQGTLRAAQHFHALHVEQAGIGAGLVGDVGAVRVQRHPGVTARREEHIADAADEQLARAVARGE